MFRSDLVVLSIALIAASPALAQPSSVMTEGEFLDRWNAAQGQKELPDKVAGVIRLTQQLVPALNHYKQILTDDSAAGRPPRACPPPGSKATVNLTALARAIALLPPDQRGAPIEDLLFPQLDRTFPCRTI